MNLSHKFHCSRLVSIFCLSLLEQQQYKIDKQGTTDNWAGYVCAELYTIHMTTIYFAGFVVVVFLYYYVCLFFLVVGLFRFYLPPLCA